MNGQMMRLFTNVHWTYLPGGKQVHTNYRKGQEIMNIVRNCIKIFGVGVIVTVGIMLYVKLKRDGRQAGMYENLGKNIDEKLNASKAALDRASSHVQSVFEHIKNRKP